MMIMLIPLHERGNEDPREVKWLGQGHIKGSQPQRNWGRWNNPYATMPPKILTELHCSSTSSLTALTSDSSWNWTLASSWWTPCLWKPQSWVLVSDMWHVPSICTCCVFRFDVKKSFCKGKWQVTPVREVFGRKEALAITQWRQQQ